MMRQLDGTTAIVLNAGYGMVLQVLLPAGDGRYWALWVFDIDDEARRVSQLIMRITVEEADEIVRADPYHVGFLEPVRATMAEPHGQVVVTRFGGAVVGGRDLSIPPGATEDEFVEMLFAVVEGIARGSAIDVPAVLLDLMSEAQAMAPAYG